MTGQEAEDVSMSSTASRCGLDFLFADLSRSMSRFVMHRTM